MGTVFDAIAAFWDYLASVRPLPLAIAIGCHIAKTMCTSRAWRNVLAAAYPETRVRWISIYGAYIAGVGVKRLSRQGFSRHTAGRTARSLLAAEQGRG